MLGTHTHKIEAIELGTHRRRVKGDIFQSCCQTGRLSSSILIHFAKRGNPISNFLVFVPFGTLKFFSARAITGFFGKRREFGAAPL